MTAGLEHAGADTSGEGRQPARGPAMRTYCATLSRFTSSVQSTEQTLRNDEADTREDSEQREVTATSRLRGIERASSAAEAGIDHCASVRDEHGLPPSAGGGLADRAGLERLRRPGSADLGVALTSLGRRRDELRLAEAEFEHWLRDRDELSRRIVLGVTGVVGVVGAAVMFAAGSRTSAAVSLILLVTCAVAVVAAALATAAARRLPRICDGPGLARRPHAASMARYGAVLAGATALGLAAVNVAAGSL